MSIASSESAPLASTPDSANVSVEGVAKRPRKRVRRKSTSHLKLVPETLAERERIKAEAERFAEGLDRSQPFNSDQLEIWGRQLLDELELTEKFLGFAAVLIGNFFWKRQFLAVPFERRMLLLPHCLKHAEGCPAEYDEFGLDCDKCGACSIADYKVRAEQLGYKVLVAEGSPVVLKIIVSGHVDGILGVACLNVLEKAIDKVLIAVGIQVGQPPVGTATLLARRHPLGPASRLQLDLLNSIIETDEQLVVARRHFSKQKRISL